MKSTCQELVEHLRIGRSKSYEDMIMLSERHIEAVPEDGDKAKATSPVSVMTQRSADKVMLKKHSSSRILPSRSRRLWWKLFMWSHRNVYKSGIAKPHSTAIDPDTNLHGGYCSDTAEPRQHGLDSSRIKFQTSLKRDCNAEDQRWDKFYGVAGMWPQNQWVACPTESSSFARVDEWVKEISVHAPFQPGEDDNGESHALHTARNQQTSIFSEVSHANSVIQSLNASSSVAHMTGIQLKVIPSISRVSSLRSVNLSGNLIAHISSGSLPKGLHVLNLSKNKISTIEGLRDLTRLRVIDLSYNRISRIGRGLSNCTLVKELYLAGNKISMVEGIHRLLKLAVLDLSFNKIATTKAIGQLVANHHSLVALNLLGNPIRTTISEEQLRKTVSCLLPKLALLNKQPIAVLRNHSRGKQGKMGRSHGKNVTTNAATSVQGWKGHSQGRRPSNDKA